MLSEVEYRKILLILAWFLDNDTSDYLWSWLEPHFEMRLVKEDMDKFITGASKKFEFFCKRAEVDISLAKLDNAPWMRWGWDSDKSFSSPNLDACPQPMRFGLKNRINGHFRFQGRIPDIHSPHLMWDIVDTKRDQVQYYIDGICVGVTSLPPWAQLLLHNPLGITAEEREYFCDDYERGHNASIRCSHEKFVRYIMDEEESKIIS